MHDEQKKAELAKDSEQKVNDGNEGEGKKVDLNPEELEKKTSNEPKKEVDSETKQKRQKAAKQSQVNSALKQIAKGEKELKDLPYWIQDEINSDTEAEEEKPVKEVSKQVNSSNEQTTKFKKLQDTLPKELSEKQKETLLKNFDKYSSKLGEGDALELAMEVAGLDTKGQETNAREELKKRMSLGATSNAKEEEKKETGKRRILGGKSSPNDWYAKK